MIDPTGTTLLTLAALLGIKPATPIEWARTGPGCWTIKAGDTFKTYDDLGDDMEAALTAAVTREVERLPDTPMLLRFSLEWRDRHGEWRTEAWEKTL